MEYFNTSGDKLKFMMDIGNGQELITVEPYQSIEIPERCEHALPQMAPQLIKVIDKELMESDFEYKPELDDVQLQVVEPEPKPEPDAEEKPEFRPEFVEEPRKPKKSTRKTTRRKRAPKKAN